jgi:alanyl-tRNA synthetase
MLGFGHANMFQLVPALQKEMGQAYPELIRADALISETLKLEEQRFRKMLDRGLGLLEDETADLAKGGELAGDVAFKLYDTYGFPLDLTQDALREKGMTVDVDGFQKALDKQRADARAAWSGTGDAATEKVWFDIRDAVPATEFLGYTGTTTEAQVLALVKDGVPVESVQAGDKVSIIVNQTSFYAESGGQAGDTGQLTTDAGVVIDITDTQKRVSDLHDHIGTVVAGTLRVGDDVRLVVEGVRRDMLRANHSATHLLHAALRKRLGNHVTQRGSMVSAERLRFDISHQQALTAEELRDIEADVNAQIRANTQVSTRVMDSESAIEAGAMALFGEKYGDEVRVVAMGAKNHDTGIEFSVELCGGIHVQRTGDIGAFKIVLETAVGSGIRRIEAVTGRGAEQWIATRESTLLHAAELLKVTPANIPERILALQEDRKKMEKEIAELRKQLATGGSGHTSESIGGYTFVGKVLDGVPAKDLKGMADELKKQIKSGIVALIAVNDGKVSLVVGVTDDIKAEISAVDLVKAGAAAVGGKGGGGRPDMAQAGGPDANNAAAAIDAIKAFIEG